MIRHGPSAVRDPSARSRGQALAEFALVFPIFLLILFSIIDFGRYVYYVQILNNAAREGARYAIVHGSLGIPASGSPFAPGTSNSDPSGANVKAVVRQNAIGVIGDTAVLRIDAVWDAHNGRGQKVRVTVEYDFDSIIPIVPIPPIEITGESTLVINN
jgi:Flp pilus assembly protein TadG